MQGLVLGFLIPLNQFCLKPLGQRKFFCPERPDRGRGPQEGFGESGDQAPGDAESPRVPVPAYRACTATRGVYKSLFSFGLGAVRSGLPGFVSFANLLKSQIGPKVEGQTAYTQGRF